MLLQAIENQIFRKLAPMAIRHMQKPDLRTRNPLARKVLDQAAREFQLAPPITIHFGDPELMAGVWCLTREAYVVGAKGRALREAVAAAVSELNQCPYCVTVHAGMYASTGRSVGELENSLNRPPDIESAYVWAAATLSPDSKILSAPKLATADIPQLFATAVAYHYINRMVSVFLGETPVAIPGMTTALGRKLAHASFRLLGKRIVALDPQPGQCSAPKDAELPVEFAWARSNPAVAGALAHFALTAERVGREAVPDDVRALVLDHLRGWDGEPAPLSRGWTEEVIAPLNPDHKPSARLALLSARAAHQIDDGLIREFRKWAPDERSLLRTVAWASFATAQQIAGWFPNPVDDQQGSGKG